MIDEWEVDENHPFMSHLSSDPLESGAEEVSLFISFKLLNFSIL